MAELTRERSPSQAQVKGEICRLPKCSSVASTHASADDRPVLKNPLLTSDSDDMTQLCGNQVRIIPL